MSANPLEPQGLEILFIPCAVLGTILLIVSIMLALRRGIPGATRVCLVLIALIVPVLGPIASIVTSSRMLRAARTRSPLM